MGVREPPWTEAEQSGEQFPGGRSSAMHDKLHSVTDLRLLQLPSFRQDMPAQHTRHSTQRKLGRHRLRQRLDLVESDLLHRQLSDTTIRRFNHSVALHGVSTHSSSATHTEYFKPIKHGSYSQTE